MRSATTRSGNAARTAARRHQADAPGAQRAHPPRASSEASASHSVARRCGRRQGIEGLRQHHQRRAAPGPARPATSRRRATPPRRCRDARRAWRARRARRGGAPAGGPRRLGARSAPPSRTRRRRSDAVIPSRHGPRRASGAGRWPARDPACSRRPAAALGGGAAHQTRELTLRCLAALAAASPGTERGRRRRRRQHGRHGRCHCGIVSPRRPPAPATAGRGLHRGRERRRGARRPRPRAAAQQRTAAAPEALGALAAAFAAAPRLGVAGAALYYLDGTPQWSGGPGAGQRAGSCGLASGLPAGLGALRPWRRLRPVAGHGGARGGVDWVPGAPLAFRRAVWEARAARPAALPSTPRTFICLGARARGWRSPWCRRAGVLHHHGATVGAASGVGGAATTPRSSGPTWCASWASAAVRRQRDGWRDCWQWAAPCSACCCVATGCAAAWRARPPPRSPRHAAAGAARRRRRRSQRAARRLPRGAAVLGRPAHEVGPQRAACAEARAAGAARPARRWWRRGGGAPRARRPHRHPPAGAPGAQAEVEVLGVEAEPLVERPAASHDRPPDGHGRAGHPVDRAPPPAGASGLQPPLEGAAAEQARAGRSPGRRTSARRARGRRSTAACRPGSGGGRRRSPARGSRRRPPSRAAQRLRRHLGVAVEQQQELAAGPREAGVGRRREALRRSWRSRRDLGVRSRTRRRRCRRCWRRPPRSPPPARRGGGERGEAGEGELPGVVGGDHHRQRCGRLASSQRGGAVERIALSPGILERRYHRPLRSSLHDPTGTPDDETRRQSEGGGAAGRRGGDATPAAPKAAKKGERAQAPAAPHGAAAPSRAARLAPAAGPSGWRWPHRRAAVRRRAAWRSTPSACRSGWSPRGWRSRRCSPSPSARAVVGRGSERVAPRAALRLPRLRAALPLLLVAASSFVTTAHPAHVADALADLAIGVAVLVGWSIGFDAATLRRLLDAALVPAGCSRR